MITAALYARVSSEKQVQENTIASQVEALKSKIIADSLTLLDEHQFIDNGFSVFDPEALLEKLSDIYENVSLIKDYCFDDFTIYINKYL